VPNIAQRNPRRGRPRKPVPARVPWAFSVPTWSQLTSESEQTVRRKIKAGELRSVQAGRGRPHRVLSSEAVRLGYVSSLKELI
jgi:hypothetical protein